MQGLLGSSAAAQHMLARRADLNHAPAPLPLCPPQTFQRVLNTSPLQYSCTSSCVAGLLHSSCSQCSGTSGASGCQALQLGATAQAAECLVDAGLL